MSELCDVFLYLSPPVSSMYFFFLLFQNLIREFDGIPIIADFLSDPKPEVRVHTLNALNNLCMNIANQEKIKVSCNDIKQQNGINIDELVFNICIACVY